MWETPFEPAMLGGSDIVIHCPYKSDVQALMELLAEHGVKWCTGENPAKSSNCWGSNKENTVYYIEDGKTMTYGDKSIATSDSYIKCTFYGEPEPEFEPANDNELLAFLGL